MKRNLTTSIIALCALLAIGLACGGSPKAEDEKDAGPEFVGTWTAADGSFITIRSDASADYKIGSTTVNGGVAKVSEKEKTLRVALLGMGSPMKIDKAPANGEMTLDGIVYKKSGGSSTSSSSNAKPEIPSKEKLQTLVKTSFLEFGDAVQSEDFTDFHKKVAKPWRDSSTPEKLNEAFKAFIDKKANYDFKRVISPLDATFSPEPRIEKVRDLDALIVRGSYDTKPITNFEFKYTMDDGSWKLIGINVQVGGEL